MKFYVKPAVDVVELSVKETIADLPVATGGTLGGYVTHTNGGLMQETVYVLTKSSTSVTNA